MTLLAVLKEASRTDFVNGENGRRWAFSGLQGSVSRTAPHIAAALGAVTACARAFFHAPDLLAAFRAGIAYLGTNSANLFAEPGTAQDEV